MPQQLGLNPTLTFDGNTPAEKLVGSIAEVKILKVLQNEMSNQFLFRAAATAENINQLAGVATALYRLTKRNVWSTKYDLNTGAEKQRGGGKYTPIQLNKMLNVKFVIEDYDISKFLEGDAATRTRMVSDWITTLTTNLMQNLELIFRRGIQDYCIARYAVDKDAVMVFDPSTITDEDSAKQFFQDFGEKMVNKIRTIDESMIGTNKSDWNVILDMAFITKLTKAFTGFIDTIGAETLVGGQLYKNSVFGTPISEDFWLDQDYNKGSERKMNVDISFDFKKTIAEVAHKQAMAMPMNFTYLRQVIDNPTGNLMWIGKCLVALPTALREKLTFIIRTTEPTEAEMTAALARGCSTNQADASPMDDLETHTFQIAIYDELHSKLGGGGETETRKVSEIKNENSELKKQLAEYAKIQKALEAERAATEAQQAEAEAEA